MNSLLANKMRAKNGFQGFLGDSVVKNPPAGAGDMVQSLVR